jgi:hypothetical protein
MITSATAADTLSLLCATTQDEMSKRMIARTGAIYFLSEISNTGTNDRKNTLLTIVMATEEVGGAKGASSRAPNANLQAQWRDTCDRATVNRVMLTNTPDAPCRLPRLCNYMLVTICFTMTISTPLACLLRLSIMT